MAKVGFAPTDKTITHPLFPEFKVYCDILDPIEAMDLFSGFSEYQKVVAVLHPVTNEPIRDADGKLETVTITNLPAKAIVSVLANVINGWEGLEGPDGPIPFKAANIKWLFAKELNVPKVTKKVIAGVETENKSSQSFADYIQSELNADIPEILSSDDDLAPKMKTSPKPV